MPLVVAMTALAFSGYSALMPVAPLWAAQGGADAGGVGLVNGMLMLTTVLTQLMVPAALRRFGWESVLVTGTLFLGLPTAGLFFGDSLGLILLVSGLRGIGFGIITVTGSALIAELVDPMRRGEAIGVYGLAVAAPQILFISTGPWFAERFGFETMFAVGLLPILGAVPAYILGRRMERLPKPLERAPYRNLLRPILLLLAVTLAGGAIITFLAQMVSAPWMAMVALLHLTVFAAASRWRLGGLADEFGARRFVWPLVVATTIGMALIAFSVREETTQIAVLLMGTSLVGIGYGGLQNLTLLIAFDGVKRAHYGSASAAWNIGFDAGTGIGSVAIGAIAAGSSFSTAILVGGAISLLTLPLAIRRTPKVNG
ncbi:MFS transporter [Flaviflexus salsibiostraticola]|uniref:MFS transporter n=2 Tax=Flaviflexus salsibiostraticola TaxID=1282737 RepID=A0A3Q8WX42_9ACTO|nr:MFS transporter [Flaviflexus salsibiostraticola]